MRRIPAPSRIIHVNTSSDGSCNEKCRPSIVTGIDMQNQIIYLTTFGPNMDPRRESTTYSSEGWHWPNHSWEDSLNLDSPIASV